MSPQTSRAVVWGRRAWMVIGVGVILIALVYASSQVSVILTPFVLALFPAALLEPLSLRLRATRIPNSIVALLVVILLVATFAAAGAFITVALIDQVPEVADSLVEGLRQLDDAIDWSRIPGGFEGLTDALTQAGRALLEGGALTGGLGAAEAVGSFLTGLALMLVVLFFFIKDGRRIWQAFLDFVPARHQPRAETMAAQSFWTIGAFFRAQLLVALVDAVFIGLGLFLLGVPLVIPLSVLVFIGGLFPIVGAFLSGMVAVLVALADQGIVTALLVLGVVLLVQQLEGNVLEPLIQARTISLHPLVIILAVTAGGVLMGILGAFLAVPVAAVVARIVDNLRGRTPSVGPGSEGARAPVVEVSPGAGEAPPDGP